MFKRIGSILGIFIVLFGLGACSNKKVKNPIAAVDSKQPDKILFDRAMEAMKASKYDVARLTLQTLINTYPDSEYVARAKLAVGDSWYAEGGSAALTQAENEYKDFETFFPNMPEAAEAQLKIANIHYREMEKPDRDFTHALRAEEEYRYLIQQYPDSKLVPEAKKRLLQVQEVLGEREFRVARFYYLRQSYNAAVARFRSLIDAYPLYSGIDEALYDLGQCYQRQAENFRSAPINKVYTETVKARMVKTRDDLAAAAYNKIITTYPATERVADARKALAAMNYPVPTPTPQEIAESKKLEASRGDPGMRDKFWGYIRKGPGENIQRAATVGEPTLADPEQVSPVALLREVNDQMTQGIASSGGDNKISVESGTGTPPPNEAPPRSDAGGNTTGAEVVTDPNGIPELTPVTDPSKQPDNTHTATPPTQVNEANDSSSSSSNSTGTSAASTDNKDQASSSQNPADYSTSKKKKKKGLGKLNPF